MYKKARDVFVFYLDGMLKSKSHEQDVRILNDFMSEHRCLVLTRDITKSRQEYTNAYAIEQWQFNLPHLAFQKHIIIDFNTRIESIIYVSDDIDFITNALGSFSKTILINPAGIQMDYGRLPDLIFRNIRGFIKALGDGYWSLFGEGLILAPHIKQYKGNIGRTFIGDENQPIPVIYAGRYFGSNHYRSYIDFYSMSIRKNKDKGSALFKKFDNVFMRIFRAETLKICSLQKIDAICSIPDHTVSENECGRFAEMTSKIAKELSLDNIQPFLHRTTRQHSQKSTTSAKEREKNMKDSFTFDINLYEKKVILLDDILTSGSTLREASKTLFKAGASGIICAVLGVNQFSIDYWSNDDSLLSFHETNRLTGNSKSLKPFFSNPNTNKTTDYENAVSELYEKLNKSISSMENPYETDDDRLF